MRPPLLGLDEDEDSDDENDGLGFLPGDDAGGSDSSSVLSSLPPSPAPAPPPASSEVTLQNHPDVNTGWPNPTWESFLSPAGVWARGHFDDSRFRRTVRRSTRGWMA